MHFIIHTTNLPPQTATEQFGPVSNAIYNVTSKFSLINSQKAYAPVKGQIIVQQSTNAALVNVILKPMEANKSIPVKYFVFRGIEKSSFIQGTDDIVPTGSELIQRFWTDYNNWLSKLTTPPPTPKADVFGYDQNIIANTESIRSIFMNGHDVRPFVVQEGMWIGDFAAGATAGFEIILAESSYIPTLAYARATEHKVEITTQTGFEEKKKREEILNFIDPAAFYGLFYKTGVKINGTNTKVKKEQLYTDILEKFHTKNTIYLDIRNEEGYSYNFFENYDDGSGNNVEYSINGSSFTAAAYNNNWPILAINSTTTTNNNETDITIKLCTNDNPEPLIYHTDIVTTPDKKYGQFIGTDAILNMSAGITALWTNPLLFKAFNRQNGGVFQNVATYNRVNFYRQTAYTGSNPRVPMKTNLYKNLFGPINHSEINNNNGIRRLNLGTHNLDSGTLKENDYIQVVDRYVTWDDDIIVFQTGTTDSYQKSKAYTNNQKVGYKDKIAIKIQDNNSNNKDTLLNLYFDKFTIDDGGNEVPVINLTSNGGTRLEEHTLLGLTKAEFNTIADNQTLSSYGFDVNSNIFISLKFDTTIPFGDNKTCDRFKIELTGNDLNGHYKTELLTQTVYTLDWVTFTTKDFIETSIKQEVFDYRGIFYVDDDGDVVKLDYNLTQKVDDDFRRAYDEMMTTMIGSEIWKEYIESREHTILIRLVDIEQGLGYVLENPKSLKKGGFTLFNTSAHINSNNYIHAKLLKPNSNSGNLIYFDNISMSIFLNDSSKIPFSNFHFIAYDKSHLKKVSKKLAAEIIYHEITAHVHIDSGDLFDMEVIRGWKDPHHIIFGLDCDMVFIDTDGVEQRLPTDAGGYSINRDLIQGKIRADEFISDIMKNHLDYFVSYKGYTFEGITEEMNKLKQRLAGKDILSFVTEINE